MPRTVTVTFEDGSTHVYQGVPDSVTPEQITQRASGEFGKGLKNIDGGKDKPAAVAAGEGIMEIPRQLGLTARYAIKAGASIPAMLSDAVTGAYNTVADATPGQGRGFRFQAAMPALDNALSRAGLPEPQGANERVIGDATTAGFGAGGITAAARKGAEVTSGAARDILARLAARPGVQIAGAAGGGAAGGSVREAGGGAGAQFAASVIGGVGAGAGANYLTKAANWASGLPSSIRSYLVGDNAALQNADQQIALTLQRQGIDWTQIPERIKQSMRQDAAAALKDSGRLDGDALRRLLVFRATGTTPTVGMLTQDPGAITREMNLAKTAANSIDPSLQALPQIQNSNVAQLLRRLDEAGAATAPNAINAGRSATTSLAGRLASAESERDALYAAARDSGGRSVPMDGATFTRLANERLAQALAPKLGSEVDNILNDIATGKTPLTVEYAEQLKTALGKKAAAIQGSQGDLAHAYGIVRKALDETPLMPSPRVNPGNLPAIPGAVPTSQVTIGQQAIDAFNAARSSHRALMQRMENNPALKAVFEGAEPDQFIDKFLIGKGASVRDVQALAGELTPTAKESVRQYIVKYLRDAATNSTDDIAKFSQAAYNGALRNLGEKLGAFFSADEIQALKNVGAAAKYMQAQPAGSAVNNSNSGALVLGKGIDWLSSVSGKLPLGLKDTISGTVQGLQQRRALNPANALAALAPPPQRVPMNPLLAAGIIPVQIGQDDKGR